jgi:hypothetical protein
LLLSGGEEVAPAVEGSVEPLEGALDDLGGEHFASRIPGGELFTEVVFE